LNKLTGLFVIVFILSWTCISGSAEIIYVDVDGPNDPGSGTFEDPFLRIQAGIDTAVNGDTVKIQQGVYTGIGNYDLDPNGKAITISSTEPNNPDIIACTIIDPNKEGRGFYIHSGEDANCVISGLTIRNAYTAQLGAGIFCYNSSPSIFNCTITDNVAGLYSGGGVCCSYGNSLIMNCTISNNFARDGGGLECWYASPRLINCIISNNHVNRYGGGVDYYYSDNVVLTNCTIVGNSTDANGVGGAICQFKSNISIRNNILWANQAGSGAQMYLLFEEDSASVSYCNIQGGTSGVYDEHGQVSWGNGNTDNDPCFVSFDPNGDPNFWDFHLLSSDGRWNTMFYSAELNNDGIINLVDFAGLAEVWMKEGCFESDLNNSGTVDRQDLEIFAQYYLASSNEGGWLKDSSTSPCINAGDPNSDWAYEPWPNSKRINMGAFGGTGQASKSGNIADFNIDDRVNFIDLAKLGKLWGASQKTIEDLNDDGIVNVDDLEIVATNWLWEK